MITAIGIDADPSQYKKRNQRIIHKVKDSICISQDDRMGLKIQAINRHMARARIYRQKLRAITINYRSLCSVYYAIIEYKEEELDTNYSLQNQ